jgi:hypothetical protein
MVPRFLSVVVTVALLFVRFGRLDMVVELLFSAGERLPVAFMAMVAAVYLKS